MRLHASELGHGTRTRAFGRGLTLLLVVKEVMTDIVMTRDFQRIHAQSGKCTNCAIKDVRGSFCNIMIHIIEGFVRTILKGVLHREPCVIFYL